MNKQKDNKQKIKEKYQEMLEEENSISAEEIRQLLKEAKHILDYIKHPRRLKTNSVLDAQVYCDVLTCRELDNTIAKIVYEIKNA